MSTTVWKPHALVFASGNDITQVDGWPLDSGLSDLTVFSGSASLPGFTGTHTADPVLNVPTTQIKDILDRCTIDGVSGAFSGSNVDIEWQKMNSLTGREAVGNLSHIRARIANSLLYWTGFSADDGQLATIDSMLKPVSSNGTTDPVAISTSVALAGTAGVQSVFTLGPVKITTASLNKTLCVQSVSWQNNLTFDIVRCGGEGFVIFFAVETIRPVITVQTTDIADPFSIWSVGESLTALTVYLRKKAAGGGNVANATSEHIEFTATAGTAKPIAPRTLQIEPHSFAIDTTAAIT